MRRILIPVGGRSTDASGAATFDLGLEKTGDWRNVKVSLQTTGPAEWGLFSGGAPLTFGRGRRVTLGPELLEPQDQLQVQVSGGPVSQPILGAVSGLGGTMEEIVSGFNPAPNTIALDTSATRQKLFPVGVTPPTNLITPSFTVASGGTSGALHFQLPAGTVAVRFLVTALGLLFTYRLMVLGVQSVEQYYGDPAAPGSSLTVPVPTLPLTIPVEIDWDSQIIVQIDAPTQNINVFVSALFAPEPPGQAGAAQSVVAPSPATWQAPNLAPILINTTVLAGGNVVILAAVAGQQVRIFSCSIGIDAAVAGAILLQDTTGANYHGFETSGPLIPNPLVGLSAPLPVGVGVRLQNPLGANVTCRGSLVASQS